MIVALHNLRKSYGERVLWRDLTVTFHPHRLYALTGPSGCGKSTLLNCIGLIEYPDEGSITFDAQQVFPAPHGRRRINRRDVISYLFQNYALVETESIEDNLTLAVAAWPRGRRPTREQRDSVLERVGLGGRRLDMVHSLSGGEQQRVALARLLLRRPRIILADEPTGALDDANADMVVAALRDEASRGALVIIATHDGRVADACDERLHLSATATHAGASRVTGCGSP